MRRTVSLLAMFLAACSRHSGAAVPGAEPTVERLRLRVVATHPHDPAAYTQGLVWHDGQLFESTGLYGESSLRRVDLATGRIEQLAPLPGQMFGEGLARVGERLVQLTWREGVARVVDLASFELLAEHRYAGEGWGLCFDGTSLVMSDGSDRLTFRDPADFSERRLLQVRLDGAPVQQLNELECAGGWIYANVYGSDVIVRIDPASGVVRAIVDASGLLEPAARRGADALNGIAFDGERGLFLITGKLWPVIFAVELVPG